MGEEAEEEEAEEEKDLSPRMDTATFEGIQEGRARVPNTGPSNEVLTSEATKKKKAKSSAKSLHRQQENRKRRRDAGASNKSRTMHKMAEIANIDVTGDVDRTTGETTPCNSKRRRPDDDKVKRTNSKLGPIWKRQPVGIQQVRKRPDGVRKHNVLHW